MNGMCANSPLAKSLDGRSGMIPPGPSITGENANSSWISPSAKPVAVKSSSVDAERRQSKVLLEFMDDAHSGTPETKNCQADSRAGPCRRVCEAAEPDSNIWIFLVVDVSGGLRRKGEYTYGCPCEVERRVEKILSIDDSPGALSKDSYLSITQHKSLFSPHIHVFKRKQK